MPNPGNATHRLATVAGISAVLWLSACGGSSKPSGQSASSNRSAATTTSRQSSEATRSSAHTQPGTGAGLSTETQTTSSSTTQTTTTFTQSATLPPAQQARHDRAARAAIVAMTKCLEAHGVHVPPQKLSGTNPTFNTKGLHAPSSLLKQCISKASAVYNKQEGT